MKKLFQKTDQAEAVATAETTVPVCIAALRSIVNIREQHSASERARREEEELLAAQIIERSATAKPEELADLAADAARVKTMRELAAAAFQNAGTVATRYGQEAEAVMSDMCRRIRELNNAIYECSLATASSELAAHFSPGILPLVARQSRSVMDAQAFINAHEPPAGWGLETESVEVPCQAGETSPFLTINRDTGKQCFVRYEARPVLRHPLRLVEAYDHAARILAECEAKAKELGISK